jgi:Flp pilus assembly protein TadG
MIKSLRVEKANALVEFALILPLLIFFILGTFDLSHGFVTYISLSNGAREGARWVSTHPRTDNPVDDARTRVLNIATGIELDPDQITITPNQTSYAAGDEVTVKVDYSYPLLFNAIGLITLPMHVEATMTVLY